MQPGFLVKLGTTVEVIGIVNGNLINYIPEVESVAAEIGNG